MKNLCLFALFAAWLLGSAAQAEVVYTNAVNSSSFVTISSALGSRGQTFTKTGPAAKNQSVMIYLKNKSNAVGSLSVVMRSITGTPGSGATFNGTDISTSNAVTVTGNYASLTAGTFTFTTPGTALKKRLLKLAGQGY